MRFQCWICTVEQLQTVKSRSETESMSVFVNVFIRTKTVLLPNLDEKKGMTFRDFKREVNSLKI